MNASPRLSVEFLQTKDNAQTRFQIHRKDFKQLDKKFLKELMLCISLQYQSRSQLSI